MAAFCGCCASQPSPFARRFSTSASLSVGDVAVLECQYIVDNNSGVISYKKVGTDTSTGLGVTTLSLASSMSAVPANKEVNLFITATNLGTTGIANVSTQMNYTWIK